MASFFDVQAAANPTNTTDTTNKPATGVGTGRLPVQNARLIRICLINNEVKGSAEYTGDYAMFQAWLDAALPSDTNVKYKLDEYWAQEEQYPTREDIDHYDAILLSGSAADAWGDDKWISLLMLFVQTIANKHPWIKIFGICFGSQIVGRALGGKVQPNPKGWEIGVTEVETTYMGKLLFGVEELNLLLFHQDVVVLNSLSDYFTTGDLYLLGKSLRTPCQGIVKFYPYDEHTDRPADELVNRVHILTTQGHPEYTEEIVTQLLRERHANGKVDDAGHQHYFGEKGHLTETEPIIKQDTGKRWFKHYDGIKVVGRTFWRMLGVSYGSEHPPIVPP